MVVSGGRGLRLMGGARVVKREYGCLTRDKARLEDAWPRKRPISGGPTSSEMRSRCYQGNFRIREDRKVDNWKRGGVMGRYGQADGKMREYPPSAVCACVLFPWCRYSCNGLVMIGEARGSINYTPYEAHTSIHTITPESTAFGLFFSRTSRTIGLHNTSYFGAIAAWSALVAPRPLWWLAFQTLAAH